MGVVLSMNSEDCLIEEAIEELGGIFDSISDGDVAVPSNFREENNFKFEVLDPSSDTCIYEAVSLEDAASYALDLLKTEPDKRVYVCRKKVSLADPTKIHEQTWWSSEGDFERLLYTAEHKEKFLVQLSFYCCVEPVGNNKHSSNRRYFTTIGAFYREDVAQEFAKEFFANYSHIHPGSKPLEIRIIKETSQLLNTMKSSSFHLQETNAKVHI